MRSRSPRPGSLTRRSIERVRVLAQGVERRPVRDALSTEEPLEIRVRYADGSVLPITITMRTPGADFELAAGFLHAEGVLEGPDALIAMRYCEPRGRDEPQRYNRVTVHLGPGAAPVPSLQRSFATTSACGVCGKSSIDAVLSMHSPAVHSELRVTAATLVALPGRLRAAQSQFERTGGLHAAGLFDAAGALLRVREDVGRHNAMDKLVGASLMAGELPLSERLMLVSGRLSFELVQKAARAGVALLAGVSAPSSLAVELADQVGMTLVGFLRESSFNVYTGGARISDTSW